MAARMRMLLVSLTLFSLLLSPFAPVATASGPAPSPVPAAQPEAISWCVAGGFNGWNNASDMLWDDGVMAT